MLSVAENELICRVGPGTPMGNLMRQYWIPAMLSSELPTPDCDPVRLLVLGERLIAFRDSAGKVGILANHCPHRGASLFFGRNEESGLRCVYHGWKFDTSGACIDMPNEPAESDFRTKVKAVAYPTQERNGAVWMYMGPESVLPPLPDIEANVVPGSRTLAVQHDHNWLQVLEGTIDTIHAGFLHSGSRSADDAPQGTFAEFVLRRRSAQFAVIDTEAGTCHGAFRQATPGNDYWRIAQFMLPFYGMSPTGGPLGGAPSDVTACVPMDDEHTMYVKFASGPANEAHRRRQARRNRLEGGGYGYVPNTTDWYGRFNTPANAANDYLIDREVQRRNEGPDGYSGIPGVREQDRAITSSMGPIYYRPDEHLGTSDAGIIRARRRLINAARAFAETGTRPPGVANPEFYQVRSGEILLPQDENWVEATKELRKGFVEHPDVDWSMAEAR
jgi:phthalate 4,5-dioxygenase oxygenase subunit